MRSISGDTKVQETQECLSTELVAITECHTLATNNQQLSVTIFSILG